MRIASSSLSFTAAHQQVQRHEVHERLEVRRGTPPSPVSAPVRTDTVELSGTAPTAASEGATEGSDAGSTPQLDLLRRMIEALTGRPMRLFNADCLCRGHADTAAPPPADSAAVAPAGADWGLRYDRIEHYAESEQLSVQSEGLVRTSDGQEIRFALNLSLSRSYAETSQLSLRLGSEAQRKDPLVLNFAGTAAELREQTFRFDIDADGQQDELPLLGAGSGFLAFDRNQNGRIDDGRELFGARSGDGFAELAQYDDDRNGWIDESDAIYRKLSIWRPDSNTDVALQALQDADVGAIALTAIDSPYAYRDAANQPRGELRATGVYLRESGSAGTIQQLDFVV